MRLITADDIHDLIEKIYSRGFAYILPKFTPISKNRTKSTFNALKVKASNYWIIPEVNYRFNQKISGDKQITYEEYVVNQYLNNKSDLVLLSLGSGFCSHEIRFAQFHNFKEVKCIDFSDKILNEARKDANKLGLKNIHFFTEDVYQLSLEKNSCDIILFHSSLHHFSDIDILLDKVKDALKKDGILIIHEYVGPKRLQLKKDQIKEINLILKNTLPQNYKERIGSKKLKNTISGPGLFRMIFTDPSEAIESERILPEIHSRFEILEEKELGGNIVMFLFKDIAHNFLDKKQETRVLLEKIFSIEDQFIESHASNLVFGIYRKP